MTSANVPLRLSIEGADEVYAAIREVVGGLREYGQAADRAGRNTDSLESKIESIKAAWEAEERAAEQAAAARSTTLQSTQIQAAETSRAMTGFSQSSQLTSARLSDATNQAGQMAGALGNLAATAAGANPVVGVLGSAVGTVGTAMSALSTSMGPVGIALAAVAVAAGIATTAMQLLGSSAEESGERADASKADFEGLKSEFDLDSIAASGLSSELSELSRRSSEAGGSARNAAEAYRELGRAIRTAQQEQRTRERIAQGYGSTEELTSEQDRLRGISADTQGRLGALRSTRASLQERLQSARQGGQFREASSIAQQIQAYDAQIRATEQSLASVEERVGRVDEAIAEAQSSINQDLIDQMSLDDEAARSQASGRRSGGRPARAAAESADPAADPLAALRLEQELAYNNRLKEIEQERHNATVQGLRDALVRQEELDMEAKDRRLASEEEFARKILEQQEQAEAAQRESLEALTSDAEQITGPIVSGLTDALSATIAGTESADEAFQGMLAGFLEMISQRAVIEAAAQYAAAVGALASQNYAGFAGHIAAGTAWAGVAVAAGAAAVAAAPSANQPAEPTQEEQTARQGDVVINWNSPVVTATTRADLGREIGRTAREGARRFGAGG